MQYMHMNVCVCVFKCLRKYVCKLSDSVQKNSNNNNRRQSD